MGVYVREKHGRLYLDIYKDGVRRWESTGLTISKDATLAKEARRTAEIIRAKREIQLVAESWDLPDRISGKLSLVSYAEELAQGREKDTSLPKSLPYLREHAGTIQLSAVNERWLEGYKTYLLKTKNLGPGTARNYLQAVGYVLRQAEINRKITRNPAVAVKKIQAEESIKVYLEKEELQALASAPLTTRVGRELCMGFFFACYTGLRVSDIRSLKWGDIERRPKPHIVKRQKKTKGIVGIPLNDSAWAIINDGTIHKAEEPVFPLLADKKSSSSEWFEKWRTKAKVEKAIGWHTARHTFAVLGLEAGADLYTISTLLGHKNISTTQVYAKVTDGTKRRAVEGLPEIGFKKGEGRR